MIGMAIKAYSKAKDGNKKVSANFRVREFACTDGSDPIFIDSELVTILQKIRAHFGKIVTITSAYRTPGKIKPWAERHIRSIFTDARQISRYRVLVRRR